MSETIAPENEQFINQAIAEGTYTDRAEVVNAALTLLRSRAELLAKIDEGTRQLQNGEYTEYDDESLKAHFEDIKARGRQRYEEHKRQQQSQ